MSKLDVVTMRPFVPAKNFETSLRFYTDLGFDPYSLGDGLASIHLGSFAFLLQDYYVKDWANNFMMHLLVQDLDAWWGRIGNLRLHDRYDVKAPAEPKLQSWGLVVSYVWDPSGVLWHFAQELKREEPASI
jgi:hypothetical protein